MEKRTKIVATLGPASSKKETIKKLINEGVNLFRFNLKHNDHSWHKEKIRLVRTIAQELNINVGIIADLQGPDIRIGELSKEELVLEPEKEVYLENTVTEENSIELDSKFLKRIKEDQKIAIDDGKHRLVVTEKISENKVKAKVEEGGILTSKKSVFFPDLNIEMPAISEKDRKDTELAVEVKAEYIALSFVREREDILELRELIKEKGGNNKIISKIETLKSVKNIEDILKVSDALMVARGDLGVEMYLEAVPAVQKRLISRGLKSGKPVIVATQMLKSMVENPSPTRAEISDVANASYDMADAVMLSEESAIGEYPVKTVHYMTRTLKYNEMTNVSTGLGVLTSTSQTQAIVLAADNLQKHLRESKQNPEAFIVLTESGSTAQFLAATRPELPIYAFTQSEQAAGNLTLSWGVTPYVTTFKKTIEESVKEILKQLEEKEILSQGDSIIIISGQNIGTPGQTDSLRVITV